MFRRAIGTAARDVEEEQYFGEFTRPRSLSLVSVLCRGLLMVEYANQITASINTPGYPVGSMGGSTYPNFLRRGGTPTAMTGPMAPMIHE